MESCPSVIVVSCSNTKPKSLLKLITKETSVNEEFSDVGKIIQAWIIDTKYYTAKINVIGLEDKYERTQEFNDNVEAYIIHMDTNKDTGLEDLKKWESIENDCQPEVKLLVANYCTDETKITKTRAIEWCLKKGFEFVELYPTIDKNKENNDEEVIKEKFGVDRIVEALQTHAWSNLVIKPKQKHNKKTEEVTDGHQSNSGDGLQKSDEILTDEGLDDFSDLFSQLHMMKDSFQSMPTSQRKQCAEQMVTAFWKAIGGEEEEIFDL